MTRGPGMEMYVESADVERCCQPVYETDEAALLGQRLVLTSWMLLDELKQCQEETERLMHYVGTNGFGAEQRCGVPVNPVAERLERVHYGVSHVLKLLWRSGLWAAEGELMERAAADGKTYRVLREPFTDGKAHGRPLPDDAPVWQRELLGLPTGGEGTKAVVHGERSSASRKAA